MTEDASVDSPGAGSVVASPGAVVEYSATPRFLWSPAPGECLCAPGPNEPSFHPHPAGEKPVSPDQWQEPLEVQW